MNYQAPLRDMRFVLHELFDLSGHCQQLGIELDRDTLDGILEEPHASLAKSSHHSIATVTNRAASGWAARSPPRTVCGTPIGNTSNMAGPV